MLNLCFFKLNKSSDIQLYRDWIRKYLDYGLGRFVGIIIVFNYGIVL